MLHKLKPMGLHTQIREAPKTPELIRVPADEVIEGVVCCSEIWELPTHWHNNRTRICTEDTPPCELCPIAPFRLFGLVAVYRPRKQAHVWVQLTVDAIETIRLEIRNGLELLGSEIEIGRLRKTMKAPIYAKLKKTYTAPARLPKALEPHETIARVFFSTEKPRKNRKPAV